MKVSSVFTVQLKSGRERNEARKMADWLKAHTSLTEDPSSIPCPCQSAHEHRDLSERPPPQHAHIRNFYKK